MFFPFTIHHSPFTMRYQFTVIHEAQWLIVNSKYTANSQRPTANGASKGGVL